MTVSLEPRGEEWEMAFADTGAGISPQHKDKIFEPFQSQFEGGTGLGLAIVYQIVQAHEGKVFARSKLGEGSTFVLRLRRMAADDLKPMPGGSKPQAEPDEILNAEAAPGGGGEHG